MHTILMLVVAAVIVVALGRTGEFDAGYRAGLSGQYEAAIQHYTKALQSGELSRENRARALNNRAIAFHHSGRFDRALADFDEAMMLEPGDTGIARNRAVTQRARHAASPPFAEAAVEASELLQVQERIRLLGIL